MVVFDPAGERRDVALQAGRPRFPARLFSPQERRLEENKPHRLASWSAEELAKMPTYYIMDLADDMPAGVAKEMPSAAEIAACQWLPDRELAVYAGEYQRNGFQGGLNWYRSRSGGAFESELQLFSGRTIDVPSIFISGTSDWGVYQRPGAVERMQGTACTRMVACHLLDGAGHWVQQEQARRVGELLVEFLRTPDSLTRSEDLRGRRVDRPMS